MKSPGGSGGRGKKGGKAGKVKLQKSKSNSILDRLSGN